MNDDLINKRVKIKSTETRSYLKQELIGKYGTIKRVSMDNITSRGSIGVLVDGKLNLASQYGLFWFGKDNLEFVKNESEENVMEGFKNVAIVNLLEDYNKKDYAFAVYDEDLEAIFETERTSSPAMVVVNARGKNNRVLGTLKELMPVSVYNGTKITAEVVGVVNMSGYVTREEEKERLAEMEKRKAAIEAELEKEINKRKSVEYYEEMARKYSDNPRLLELVGELRSLAK